MAKAGAATEDVRGGALVDFDFSDASVHFVGSPAENFKIIVAFESTCLWCTFVFFA